MYSVLRNTIKYKLTHLDVSYLDIKNSTVMLAVVGAHLKGKSNLKLQKNIIYIYVFRHKKIKYLFSLITLVVTM